MLNRHAIKLLTQGTEVDTQFRETSMGFWLSIDPEGTGRLVASQKCCK